LSGSKNSVQNKSDPEAVGRDCRTLLRATDQATLATIEHTNTQQPYASLVMIACRYDAMPVFLLSDLAEHTQNIKANQHVSLLIDGTAGLDNPLTGARVTLQGNITKSDTAADRQRFVNRHPSAADYVDFGDFSIYTFALKHAHLVAGFGRIHWVEDTHIRFDPTNAKALADAEPDILAHMNADHSDAVTLYAHLANAEPGSWVMTGIDPEGLDLRSGGRVTRLNFEKSISDADSARTMLARLAKQARKRTV
jgi:heme iron utilization protein